MGTTRHKQPPGGSPAKKRDRNADGWQMIGLYVQHGGVVDMRDREIGAALRWFTSQGIGDSERVRQIRAHVTNKSRRERETGATGAARVFSGWAFGYRDIKGSPSELVDGDTGQLYSVGKGGPALLGDLTRRKQHDSENLRMAEHARQQAAEYLTSGYINTAAAWLKVAVEIDTFGQPREATLEELKRLVANPS